MIETLLFGASLGFMGGVLADAVLRGNKVQKAYEDGRALGRAEEFARRPKAIKDMADSQSRLADALAAKNERLERIAAQETLGANATVKRMAAIARGEA
jgi:hypothetical protein